jgi:hypothetical protein
VFVRASNSTRRKVRGKTGLQSVPVAFSQSVSLEYSIKRSRGRLFVRARRVLIEGGRGTGLRSVPVVFSTCFELRRVLEEL